MTPRTRARQGGFSYIEILVSILLLGLVAGGIGQGISQTSGALGRAKTDTAAGKLAAAELDRVHRMTYEDVGISGGSPPGTIQGTTTTTVGGISYRIDVDVIYVDDPALGQPRTYVNYKKVTVVVTPQTTAGKPYTATTLVAPPAIGSIANKSTIVATLIDALTEQPLQGFAITADKSTSPTQTRSTGADGKVVFAGLEPSAVSSSDPKYKYRLTVGLPAGWVTHPDSVPSEQHLAPSQTWATTIKVFKATTIVVNLRDSQTGQLVTEASKVQVTSPPPDPLSEIQEGTAGSYTFTEIGGTPIQPSASNFTVAAEADCYQAQSAQRPVPVGYPTNTTEVFDLSMVRVGCGTLDVTVRSSAQGNPVVTGVQVQVSGGQAQIAPVVRTTDANGFVRFKIQPSGSAGYVVSAARAGFGAGSVLAVVQDGQTTAVTLYLVPAGNLGTVRLWAWPLASNKLVRLKAQVGTYDASQYTNTQGFADFTGLASGTYTAYIATGFSGGQPTWSAGKLVSCVGGQVRQYLVP